MCEGAVTEVAYFVAFHVPSVVVKGEGKGTTSLVEAARRYADQSEYTQVWVVYDKDDASPDQFNQAHEQIRRLHATRPETWGAAWSNQAFELWFLLHFRTVDAKLHRDLLCRKLTEVLPRPYAKNDPTMYDLLQEHQAHAIQNARRLAALADDDELTPADANPCTHVFRLVEALNAQIR